MWMLRSTTAGPIVVVYVLVVVVSPDNFLLNARKRFHIDPFEPLHSPCVFYTAGYTIHVASRETSLVIPFTYM
jgi:hypothetical protein